MTKMGQTRRKYDDKFRAGAVVMLEAAGYPEKEGSLAYVARHLNVPAPTLHRWFHGKNNPPPSEIVSEKKEDLQGKLENIIYKILGVMPDKLDDANLQQCATALGIAFDKLQLLKGKPTEIVNSGLTDEERGNRITALLDRARTRRVGQPTVH